MKNQRIFRLAIALIMGLIIIGSAIVSLPTGKVDAIRDLARTQHDVIVNYVPETYVLTGTQTITPARSFYLLAPPTTLTATLGTGNALAGDLVIFINTVATSTIFPDTGDMLGTRTLDEDGDSIGFRFDGSEWVEQFFVDQSNGGGFTGDVTYGVDGTGVDVTFYSDTAGDYMLWDQSEEGLVITGTNGQNALSVTDGDVDVADNLTLGGFELSTSGSITPTDGGVITPTTGIVILTPAGEVTPTIAACTGGEHLILYNSENQTINLADSGNFVLTGALTLGQYDTLSLACIATKWVQLGPVSAN